MTSSLRHHQQVLYTCEISKYNFLSVNSCLWQLIGWFAVQTAHVFEVGWDRPRRLQVPEGPDEPDVSVPQSGAGAAGTSCPHRKQHHHVFILKGHSGNSGITHLLFSKRNRQTGCVSIQCQYPSKTHPSLPAKAESFRETCRPRQLLLMGQSTLRSISWLHHQMVPPLPAHHYLCSPGL